MPKDQVRKQCCQRWKSLWREPCRRVVTSLGSRRQNSPGERAPERQRQRRGFSPTGWSGAAVGSAPLLRDASTAPRRVLIRGLNKARFELPFQGSGNANSLFQPLPYLCPRLLCSEEELIPEDTTPGKESTSSTKHSPRPSPGSPPAPLPPLRPRSRRSP